jgi:STIMATE family
MANDDENADDENDSTNNNDSTNYTCRVYDTEDLFTFAVQIILGVIAVTVLYWKRYFEHPRRLFAIWFLDVSKQGIGCIYAHILNMIIAAVLSRGTTDGDESTDECAWYGISFVIDTTIGLALSLVLLHYVEKLAVRYQITPLLHMGVYTGDSAMYHWTAQLLAWISILSVAKLAIYAFMWLCAAPLATIASLLFTLPFTGHRRWELVFVMILMPAVLNCVYFWIADNNLKAGDDEVAAHEVDDSVDDHYYYDINNKTKEQSLQQELPRNQSADTAAVNVASARRNWTVFGKAANAATAGTTGTAVAPSPLAVPTGASV